MNDTQKGFLTGLISISIGMLGLYLVENDLGTLVLHMFIAQLLGSIVGVMFLAFVLAGLFWITANIVYGSLTRRHFQVASVVIYAGLFALMAVKNIANYFDFAKGHTWTGTFVFVVVTWQILHFSILATVNYPKAIEKISKWKRQE